MNHKHRQRIDAALQNIRDTRKHNPGADFAVAVAGRTEFARGLMEGLQAAGQITGDELLAELDALAGAYNDVTAPTDAAQA